MPSLFQFFTENIFILLLFMENSCFLALIFFQNFGDIISSSLEIFHYLGTLFHYISLLFHPTYWHYLLVYMLLLWKQTFFSLSTLGIFPLSLFFNSLMRLGIFFIFFLLEIYRTFEIMVWYLYFLKISIIIFSNTFCSILSSSSKAPVIYM